MQNIFGAGILYGTPLTDAYGNAIANPTPVRFGVSQEVSLDISFDTKMLYGQLQFPVAIARGKGKVSGKLKFGQINGATFNSIVFGQTLSAGIVADVYDVVGALIPATPFTVTPTVPNAGTWSFDLGVRDGGGVIYARVASAPATGQYSVTAGVYLFATADTGKTVYIDYQYTATSTTARKTTPVNLAMGYTPTFRCDILLPFNGRTLIATVYNCVASKLSMATKLDDFTIPEIDFDAFADPNTGNIITIATTE
jgi:hypothetical protein